MLYVHLVKVEQETLFIIGSLGVQMSSSYASGRETTTFIELNKIKDIVINEAIYMVSVIFTNHNFLHLKFEEKNGKIDGQSLCHFSIKSSTTFVYCWKILQTLMQCPVLCRYFR